LPRFPGASPSAVSEPLIDNRAGQRHRPGRDRRPQTRST